MIRLYNTTKRAVDVDGFVAPLSYRELENLKALDELTKRYPRFAEMLKEGEFRAYDTEKDKAAINRLESFKAAVLAHGNTKDIIYADDDFGQYAALLRQQRNKYGTVKANEEDTDRQHAERLAFNDMVKSGL